MGLQMVSDSLRKNSMNTAYMASCQPANSSSEPTSSHEAGYIHDVVLGS